MVDNSKYTPNPRQFSKSNFVDLLELLTPKVYQQEDLALSGTEINPLSKVINSHLDIANNISSILPLSSVPDSQTSSLNSLSGISQYFVKQNELTKVTTQSFRQKILLPLSANFSDFDTSGEFVSFLSSSLLPKIIPPGVRTPGTIEDNVSELSAFTEDSNASSVHNYLVDNLGWFYFLNTSALGGLDYSPSSFVLDNLSKLYTGETLETVDGVKGLTNFVWRNVEACSYGSYIPQDFLSGVQDAISDPSAGEVATYTSGTQKLDNLLTLIDVIYSPLAIDRQDFRVKSAFDDFLNAQLLLKDEVSDGPFRKILTAFGYHFADISNQVEDIKYLYDIENTEQEKLRYIADLIGFQLRGNQSEKWRHQLRTAVDIYKRSGTQQSLRSALNAIIVDSVLDIDNKIIPLWESYLPFIIWYALASGSPLFKNLKTWTLKTSKDSGVISYSTSSLEENLKLVTDSILLDLASSFPTNFKYFGQNFPFPRFYILNPDGTKGELYTVLGDTKMKPWHAHPIDAPGYLAIKRQARDFGELALWDRAVGPGPFGEGVYMAGATHPAGQERPTYLLFEGDTDFVFNYRAKYNYPLPPFEEVKYYRECVVTKPLVDLLVERLKCFQVEGGFAEQVGDFLVSSAATDTDNINSLNEFLMFFSSVQLPPNYGDVIENISDYEKNVLSLWNGKSSHIFLDFDNTDFNFRKNTLESDSKYALYETARVAQEFTPAHTIPKVNLNASADDTFESSSTRFSYLGLDDQDTRVSYSSGTVLANAEISGVLIGPSPFDPGRDGYKTFKRDRVDSLDEDLSSTNSIVGPARRAIRRRNLKFLLPQEGYYDRTGFNGPTSYDPSVIENSMPSSLGELTLGYVASAGKFHPVEDHRNVSGVWNICEDTNSPRAFSGVDTSNTFPYRGVYKLGSDAKMPEVPEATARYVDRGQTPKIIRTMHSSLENLARVYSELQISSTPSSFGDDMYWKDQVQSFANSAIASGYTINSYTDYENFSFGREFQYLFSDYTKRFGRHVLGENIRDKTGGNIFAHVFGKALYNGDFELSGANAANFIQNSLRANTPINNTNAWADGGVGTFVGSSLEQAVVPISGTYTSGESFDFRNPTILSGIEFCDLSGAPSRNEFRIIDLDSSAYVRGQENYFINNPVIKCKSVGGLPRLRFDVSSYGEMPNQLVPEHKFTLNVKSLVADERKPLLGGGQLGVWIHTEPTSGLMWSWTEDKKWTPTDASTLNIEQVIQKLCHKYTFNLSDPGIETEYCLNSKAVAPNSVNDLGLTNIKESFFHNVKIDFDTRNFTIHNNYEYLDIIPKTNEQFKITDQVHKDRNYVIEVFFIPNNNYEKYLLIDSIGLEDTTLRYQAGVSTGIGVETSGIPLRPFVTEFKYEFSKEELANILSFYNGMLGYRAGENTTNLASRDASITSGVLEVSGGSRISYRVQPEWGIYTPGTHDNYTSVEFEN